ncbi:DUF4932 domain-containing protein [Thermococcus celer]|uniref:S-layer protein C-terminal domain-containing protein n=1 Tax=Thermococcus celer Vu 13 = JCM 8558 TaxID=1293037 RepID=A0A218P0G8_THECE|nr:DUF4932 domain-containing protein [Thermococcus celer]ASI98427.1 hypothetical protein A3L02_02020 [Thermococcus celer Vu 13 = JCM 8558]
MRRLGVLIILALLITALSPGVTGTNVTGKVSVEINPNSELLSIVYYLAFGRNDPFIIERGGYLDDVDRYFGPYRNHPAVGMLRDYLGNSESVSERDMRLYYLEDELLLCTKPPELNPGENIGDRWTLDFIRALRDFAERSHFMEFYESHRGYYDEDLRIYEGALSLLPPDEFMGPYLDLSNVRFEFKHPFLVAVHGHSFNPVKDGVQVYGAGGMVPLVRRDAQRTLWSYRTARDTMFGLPLNRDYLNNTGLDRLIYLSFVYHELGHDVTVPALDSSEKTHSLRYLEDTIEGHMPYLARYDLHFWWDDMMIYEGFADGWADFALSNVDPDYVSLSLWLQRGWGEFWMGDMVELYWKYAGMSRENGVPIGDYVGDMLDDLSSRIPPEKAETLFQERVPITPLMAFDRGAVTGKVVVVYGTRNPDPTGTERDRETAELIADNLRAFYSDWDGNVEITVKADVNLTEEEFRENLVLVGGPYSNAVVDELDEEFPLRFVPVGGSHWVLEKNANWSIQSYLLTADEADPVKTGELGNVTGEAVVMAVRNLNDPENYIVWVAGEDRDLTALFQNPTYYLSSYEVWSEKGIEMAFYVQPLASS